MTRGDIIKPPHLAIGLYLQLLSIFTMVNQLVLLLVVAGLAVANADLKPSDIFTHHAPLTRGGFSNKMIEKAIAGALASAKPMLENAIDQVGPLFEDVQQFTGKLEAVDFEGAKKIVHTGLQQLEPYYPAVQGFAKKVAETADYEDLLRMTVDPILDKAEPAFDFGMTYVHSVDEMEFEQVKARVVDWAMQMANKAVNYFLP